MITICPTCQGHATVEMSGDAHRSAGTVPCTNPRCRWGFLEPPEHDVLVLQYMLLAIMSLASTEERTEMQEFLSGMASSFPKRSGISANPRLHAEDKINRMHRKAIEDAINRVGFNSLP